MRSNLAAGLAAIAVLYGGSLAQAIDELTVDEIVERLQVATEDEVTFNSRGLRPAPNEPNSGQITNMRILFEFNSDILTDSARSELDKYGEALSRPSLSGASFSISGHTDSVGSEDYNLSLSERRAASVVTYLTTTHGIPLDRLTPKGYGEGRHADPDNPRSSENRRVEIINDAVLSK